MCTALGKRTATASTTNVQTPQVSALAAVEMDTAQIAGQTVTAISDSKTTSEKAKTAASKTGMEINEEQIQMRRAVSVLLLFSKVGIDSRVATPTFVFLDDIVR